LGSQLIGAIRNAARIADARGNRRRPAAAGFVFLRELAERRVVGMGCHRNNHQREKTERSHDIHFPTPLSTNAAQRLVSAVTWPLTRFGSPLFAATASLSFGAPRSPARSGMSSG